MKKLIVLSVLLALTVQAVSCGMDDNTKNPAAEISTAATSSSSADDDDPFSVDPMAGIELTAQPIADYSLPDDWIEISDGNMTFTVPPDLEKERLKYISQDTGDYVMFIGPTSWEKYDSSYIDEDFPKLSGEPLSKAFSELGIEFDGSRKDLYRALLSVTPDIRTDENAESFETAALMKSQVIGNWFPEVFVSGTPDSPVYTLIYLGALTTYSDFKDSYVSGEHTAALVIAFPDENTECSAMIYGDSFETMLKMASSAKLCDAEKT